VPWLCGSYKLGRASTRKMPKESRKFSKESSPVADPKLQIERRLDRIEEAIVQMSERLVEVPNAFDRRDADAVQETLRGEKGNASPQE
jgi:hypothetical protein